jgi:hypothetical protein
MMAGISKGDVTGGFGTRRRLVGLSVMLEYHWMDDT